MLILISPAKTLNFETPPRTQVASQPEFLDQSQVLIDRLKKLSASELSKLMNISGKLAELNRERYQSWSKPFNHDNAKQAILSFKGDVYVGLEAETLNHRGDQFAQKYLRILSGLYGVLKPLDLIQPYRLEMGTPLKISRGKSLYEFWGNRITEGLNKELDKHGIDTVINLASNEYFKVVKPSKLKAEIITPVFKDAKNGNYKVISFFAKKARGMMTRFIIENRLKKPEALYAFNSGGYQFNKSLSSPKKLVFTRG